MVSDHCDDLIDYHVACINMIKVSHKYIHDKPGLPWYPNDNTSTAELRSQMVKHKFVDLLGQDPCDEIAAAVDKVEKAIEVMRGRK